MKRVIDYIRQQGLIEKGDRVAAGLSGGADSVCLLFVLKNLCEELDFSLSAIHVNHGIRGEEAERDEEFVKNLCDQLAIPLGIYRADVRGMAKKEKLSLEEAGRKARYEAFDAYAGEHKTTKIALAHHKNDLAETMLYHLARGTGLAGLAGIRPVRGMVIRPLLCMNREEIEHYLKERHIKYVTDSTNACFDYTRNRIRHGIVASLTENVNSRAVEHMAQTAQTVCDAEDYLAAQAEKSMSRCATTEEDGVLFRDTFRREPAILQMYMLRAGIKKTADTLRDIARPHLLAVCSLFEKEVGKEVTLPGGIVAQRTYDGVRLGKMQEKREKTSDCCRLLIPGRQKLGEIEIICEIEANKGQIIPQKTYTKWLDYDTIKDSLDFRTRKQGDYLVVNHEGGRKKLKDYLIDEKVPKNKRDELCLLAAGSDILWVLGYRISEKYKIRSETKEILKIQVLGGDFYE